MKSLNFPKETNTAALVFFVFYFAYGLIRIPFVQYLVSLVAGGIAYGITGKYQFAVIALLVTHFAFMVRISTPAPVTRKKEGFMSGGTVEDITKRVKGFMNMSNSSITGVGSPMTEGFEDAGEEDLTLSTEKKESFNSDNAVAESKPAEVKPKNAADSEQVKMPEGLFKLGEIPKDSKGGLHIDSGTTVMNALNALKPDQIAAMTKDTKQLIETQKSLMNMLQSVAPMVTEGKQMMETFSSMFGPSMGAPPAVAAPAAGAPAPAAAAAAS
jgi:hypothetical protein